MINKFSIITVTKNSIDYIEETINSVINQFLYDKINKKFDLEYIIHDGNSTDGTKEIILQYSKKYDFIKFTSFQDKGLYDGLVYCLKKCTGNIIAYINAGDFYYKESFSLVNKIFSQNSSIKWVTGCKVYYNEDSEIIDFIKPFKYRNNLIKKGVYGRYLPFIQQESTFWKSDLNKYLNFNILKKLKLSGDYYIWYCFAKYTDLKVINSYISGFKYHKNQLTFKYTGKTDFYLNELKFFIEKITLKDIYHIIKDAPYWFILRNFSTYIFNNLGNNYYFDRKLNNWITKK